MMHSGRFRAQPDQKRVRSIEETLAFLRTQSLMVSERIERLQELGVVEDRIQMEIKRHLMIMDTMEAIEEARD